MRKLIHVVNINDFFPELFALTYPTIRSYAERNGYMINMITERKFPDVTEFLKRDSISFNDNYNISWKYHVDRIRYFMRDGRDVGIATNFVVSSDWTHDVWEPLSLSQKDIEDLAKKENTDTGGADGRGWGHYADEFALSYNMAKYGLKYTGVTWEDWMRPWLIHTGTGDKNEALQIARQTLEKWSRL